MDLSRWQDKLAVITGASSGIGAATARRLAAAGLRVVITARRTERLAALREELAQHGAEVHALPLDVADQAQVDDVFAQVADRWGGTDVLVANAGLGHYGQIAEGDVEHWTEMRQVNFDGFMYSLRAALAQMEGRPQGQIVAISSLNAHKIIPGMPNVYYSATKHAVRAVMEGLRAELARAKSPLKVGSISPGLVSTEFQHKAAKLAEDEQFDYRLEALSPEDIADLVCYLLSTPPNVQIEDIILRPIRQQN